MALGSTSAAHELSALSLAQLEDLDREALEAYLRRRAAPLLERLSLEAVAIKLGLAAKAGGGVVPTAAGLLLFGTHPQLMHPHWGVSAVRVNGRTLADPVQVREDLEGSVPSLLQQALAFVRQHTGSAEDQVAAADASREANRAREYPEIAVRETVLNALLHRDLRLTGRVAIRVFDDRLEVHSPGGALGPLAPLEELAHDGGVSLPRNVVLASTARLLGLGEQLGRGLPTLRRSVAEATGQEVEIHSSSSDVLVVLPSGLRAAPGSRQLS